MAFQVILVVDESGPFHQVVADVGMAIQEPIETGKLRASRVARIEVFAVELKAALALHEASRILAESLCGPRVVLEPLFEFLIVAHKILVIDRDGWSQSFSAIQG